MEIKANRMMPREEVLAVVAPRPYEDPLSVERRAAEILEGEEQVVYQAPNRLPGNDRRVQPW
jgi:hypothetical protein